MSSFTYGEKGGKNLDRVFRRVPSFTSAVRPFNRPLLSSLPVPPFSFQASLHFPLFLFILLPGCLFSCSSSSFFLSVLFYFLFLLPFLAVSSSSPLIVLLPLFPLPSSSYSHLKFLKNTSMKFCSNTPVKKYLTVAPITAI